MCDIMSIVNERFVSLPLLCTPVATCMPFFFGICLVANGVVSRARRRLYDV